MPKVSDTEHSEPGAHIAAIDVGSNAMRLGIAVRDNDGLPEIILRHREAVRLGHDAFTTGILSETTQNEALAAFRQFQRILDQHHVESLRGTATSAMRDSANGRQLAKRICEETGIKLDIISGEEEARLVHCSIAHRVELRDYFALLIDIGGGSVEITLCDDGEIIAAQSFKIGTVRLLEMLGEADDFNLLLSEYLDGARKKIREQIGSRQADLCVGTGGNALAIGDLGLQLGLSQSADRISHTELIQLIEKLGNTNIEQRIRVLGLRPDRADVILPAAMVFHEIMKLAGASTLHIPEASLLDGILLDMATSEKHLLRSRRRNLLGWAKSLKKKYHVDQPYAKAVKLLALSLFDQTRGLHGLGNNERLLLEIAARVHEIGMYVRVGGHHRHAAYLIMAAPLLGISDAEKTILAQTVRYQRKAFPDEGHEAFAALDKTERSSVCCLSAILRLAIALNKDRRNRVASIRVETDEEHLTLHLEGEGNLLLERWAVLKTSDYVTRAFNRSLNIDLNVD